MVGGGFMFAATTRIRVSCGLTANLISASAGMAGIE